MQRLASGTNHTCFHCVPTKGSCESPTPHPRDAATDPKQFGDFHRLPHRAGAGEGRLHTGGRCGRRTRSSLLPHLRRHPCPFLSGSFW